MAQQGFWSSLPGILTGLAAVITALTGMYIAIASNGESDASTVQTPPTQTEQTSPSATPTTTPPTTTPEVAEPPASNAVSTPTIVPIKRPDVVLAQPLRLQTVPQANLKSLVDCKAFPTVNTVRSLMSWSNHYHQKIEAAGASKQRALEPCKKTINYRAQAHCKAPNNTEVRQGLFETLAMCKAVGISWRDVKAQ